MYVRLQALTTMSGEGGKFSSLRLTAWWVILGPACFGKSPETVTGWYHPSERSHDRLTSDDISLDRLARYWLGAGGSSRCI
jgi:hypothetical protein